ncbi:metallophosphoesterase family protein [Bordetella genomosp. 11]|uniref:DNA repair exonuclease n=1 Tax=Bordetella genomosp. 11 TaxID=1416808 RepID=A0A261UY60_9BORD|nr:DNA repair exonuclease [Bordetella genomosp. 11]OZI66507.1 DNA repair exonuclease [Bordetella genomosp. 11]
MVRVLHTSDWQIGKLFGQFDADDAAILADARFQAVERLAAAAAAHRVDMVLVAGDVFDAQTVTDRTLHRLFNAMAAYGGPWVLIPGNHDAALSESVWTRAARLDAIPSHVHVCLVAQPLVLPAHGVAILPAPLTQRNTYTDLTEWFAGADTAPGLLRLGMAHGSVQGILADDIDSPNPIGADRARLGRLDYLALGDWHGYRQIDDRTWYSGTPETDRFRGNTSGHALLVEIDGPGAAPVVTPLATGAYCWRTETLNLQVPSDVDDAVSRLQAFGAKDVVQLDCSGQVDLDGYRRLQQAIGQARGATRALLADLSALSLRPTEQDIEGLQADGYLGEVIAVLRGEQDGPDNQVARDALALLAGILDRRAGRPDAASDPGSGADASGDPGPLMATGAP